MPFTPRLQPSLQNCMDRSLPQALKASCLQGPCRQQTGTPEHFTTSLSLDRLQHTQLASSPNPALTTGILRLTTPNQASGILRSL